MNFSIALNSNPHRPNVFNRLSLQFTIKLLGTINPSLVWQIKGIIASVVVVANIEKTAAFFRPLQSSFGFLHIETDS
jgi:hypothetical protein